MHLLGLPITDDLRSVALGFLILVIVVLFVLALGFGSYALLLRIRHDRREQLWESLEEQWQEPVLLALADPEAMNAVHETIRAPYRLHFVRFCVEYALRVRGKERETLRKLAAPYLPPLRQSADDADVAIRARAIQTLGALGLPTYEETVVTALDDPSPIVSMVAARALARHGHPLYASEIIKRLGRFGGWSRNFMASILASMGPESAPALRSGYANAEEAASVRTVIGYALRLLKDLEAADIAADIVEREEDPDLLASALKLLTVVGRPEHASVIRVRCVSEQAAVRSFALGALGTVGSDDDVPQLVEALEDPSPWVAMHAARGLLAAGGHQRLRDMVKLDHPRAALAEQLLLEDGAA
jgi:HEAT repeat protein